MRRRYGEHFRAYSSLTTLARGCIFSGSRRIHREPRRIRTEGSPGDPEPAARKQKRMESLLRFGYGLHVRLLHPNQIAIKTDLGEVAESGQETSESD